MNRLVIFDLDGTLFESREMHYDTLNTALVLNGYPAISHEDHVRRFNGLPSRVKLRKLGIEGADAEEVLRTKQQRTLAWVMANVKRNEEFVKLFSDLRHAGWQIAVASNAIGLTVVRALQLLGLWKLCNFIVAGDQVACPKPDPFMYMVCMEACGAEGQTTYIVEDSEVGLEGARRVDGARVLRIEGPHEIVELMRSLMEEV